MIAERLRIAMLAPIPRAIPPERLFLRAKGIPRITITKAANGAESLLCIMVW